MVTSIAATGYVAKISMLRLNIGSGMLRLSSCMLRLSLTDILLLRWMSPFETKIKTDIPRFQHVDFWCV